MKKNFSWKSLRKKKTK